MTYWLWEIWLIFNPQQLNATCPSHNVLVVSLDVQSFHYPMHSTFYSNIITIFHQTIRLRKIHCSHFNWECIMFNPMSFSGHYVWLIDWLMFALVCKAWTDNMIWFRMLRCIIMYRWFTAVFLAMSVRVPGWGRSDS